MKTNAELQSDVQNAIRWEPLLHAAEIGVIVKDGIVTLTGTVDSYAKKLEAETATKNVAGVKAVIEKIEIRFANSWRKDNHEIAKEILVALDANWTVPKDRVKVKVEDGWVTLEGELAWNYQREAAEIAIHHLMGVKGVTNEIKIKADTHDAIEQKDVEDALRRNWSINADDITVRVSGTKVTLTGIVGSVYQKHEAGKIAWKTPGIFTVNNELEIEYDYSLVD